MISSSGTRRSPPSGGIVPVSRTGRVTDRREHGIAGIAQGGLRALARATKRRPNAAISGETRSRTYRFGSYRPRRAPRSAQEIGDQLRLPARGRWTWCCSPAVVSLGVGIAMTSMPCICIGNTDGADCRHGPATWDWMG